MEAFGSPGGTPLCCYGDTAPDYSAWQFPFALDALSQMETFEGAGGKDIVIWLAARPNFLRRIVAGVDEITVAKPQSLPAFAALLIFHVLSVLHDAPSQCHAGGIIAVYPPLNARFGRHVPSDGMRAGRVPKAIPPNATRRDPASAAPIDQAVLVPDLLN